jgi:DNA recombination-dependent growth factor C
MNLELTDKQQSILHMAVLTRIQSVKRLLEGWYKHPDEHSDALIESYTIELAILLELEKKVI